MKPHITLTLRSPLRHIALPYWVDAITQPRLRSERFLPMVDALFAQHRLTFTATQEYTPAGPVWSPQEIASGLDRVYRLVLQTDSTISRDLIASIRLLPDVEQVRAGVIDDMDLQPQHAQSFGTRTNRAARDAIYLDEAHAFSEGDDTITVAQLSSHLPEAQNTPWKAMSGKTVCLPTVY